MPQVAVVLQMDRLPMIAVVLGMRNVITIAATLEIPVAVVLDESYGVAVVAGMLILPNLVMNPLQ